MAVENFQRELYEKKLETKKYFSMAFEILKVFINENIFCYCKYLEIIFKYN